MVKDKILTWFLRNIYLPKVEIIDKPGFIFVSSGKAYLRDLAFPEYIFIELEKKLEGGTLYAVGKTFGYNYAYNTMMPRIEDVTREKFLDSLYFTIRYVESISYGRNLKHSVDYDKKIATLTAKDFIICSKNGVGHIILEGTIAGFCAYAFSDKSVEGVQTKCQGRGDPECEVIYAPSQVLKQKGLKFHIARDMDEFKIEETYLAINREREMQFSKNSLKSFIDSGFFKYDHGTIDYKNERFFICEASIMYFLEKRIKKIKGADKALFDISFDWGEHIAKAETNDNGAVPSLNMRPEQFISELMSALGWGDVSVIVKSGKYSVISNYFPWTPFADDIKYTMFKGILSGMLSGFLKRKIVLSKIRTDVLQGYFNILISE